ncbi:MAG: hypothetical protein ACHQRJ_16060 [Alphaproteobacteria bacterium]
MKRVTKGTMRRIVEEFPAVRWPDADLDELVAPKLGVITGFQDFLNQVEAVVRVDLGSSGPPGALLRSAKDRW